MRSTTNKRLLTVLDSGVVMAGFVAGLCALAGSITVVTAAATVPSKLGSWLVGPAGFVVAVAGADLLHAIVASARRSDPFVLTNVRRLRHLALCALGMVAADLAGRALTRATHTSLFIPHHSDVTLLALGLLAGVVLALAEIWQRGVDLRDDQRLTI